MKKLMFGSLLAVVLLVAYGLYLGQARDLNAGSLSVEEMASISSGVGENPGGRVCNVPQPSACGRISQVCCQANDGEYPFRLYTGHYYWFDIFHLVCVKGAAVNQWPIAYYKCGPNPICPTCKCHLDTPPCCSISTCILDANGSETASTVYSYCSGCTAGGG